MRFSGPGMWNVRRYIGNTKEANKEHDFRQTKEEEHHTNDGKTTLMHWKCFTCKTGKG